MENGANFNFKVILATLILALVVMFPLVAMIYLCAKFKDLRDKQIKQSFNTLVLKVDKERYMAILLPIFFFLRRLATAMILLLGADFVVLQYVCVITTSFIFFLYFAS